MKTFLALLLLTFAGCTKPGPPFESPLESSVQSITFQSFKTEKFKFSKSSFPSILNCLNGATEDNDPKKWQILGNIEIIHSTGSIKVALFSTSEKLGAFRADGIYYRGSSDEEFKRTIESARKNKREQNAAEQPASRPVVETQ